MKKRLLIFGIILLVVFFERIFAKFLFNPLEMMTYDLRSKIATDYGPFEDKFKHADRNIVIVAIDDYSRKEFSNNPQLNVGSFPWKRETWIDVIDFIEQGKPKAVLFDVIFEGINDHSDSDLKFAKTLKKYNNIVLASTLNDPKILFHGSDNPSRVENSDFIPTAKPLNVKIDDKKIDDLITYYSHASISDIYTGYNTMGIVNKVVVHDSVIRKAQPIFKLVKDNKTYYMPSLSFAGFLKSVGEGDEITIKNQKIYYKDRVIPIDKNGYTNISWHGSGNDYDYIPISKIFLNKGKNPDYFKDKIVIIGRTEAGTDIHPSAVSPSYTGPESNATAIDNFINDSNNNAKMTRKFISELPIAVEYLLIFSYCVLIAFVGWGSKDSFMGFFNSFLLTVLYILGCFWVFIDPSLRVWIHVVPSMYYLIATSITVFVFRFQQESAKKKEVMNMFGKFVSPKVFSNLLKTTDELVLKSVRKQITIMFCDVKDFTSLSEKSNPEDLMHNLNELFDEIVNIVFKNNGTVDKFVGDCVMAYWGDPIASDDDSYMAVKTALEIKQKVLEMGIKNSKLNKMVFDVKMGINTGEALLGLAGSQKIMSYTAMGDAVNVAARLESSCSALGHDVLISKSTYEKVENQVEAIDVGKIKVKGRDEEIEVYALIKLAKKDASEKDNEKCYKE